MLNKEIKGTVVKVSKQWWLKINKKVIRLHALDGAEFPHIIKVKYVLDGNEYYKNKWINPGKYVPQLEEEVTVIYNETKPKKAKVVL